MIPLNLERMGTKGQALVETDARKGDKRCQWEMRPICTLNENLWTVSCKFLLDSLV